LAQELSDFRISFRICSRKVYLQHGGLLYDNDVNARRHWRTAPLEIRTNWLQMGNVKIASNRM